jgi:hypothetical protein
VGIFLVCEMTEPGLQGATVVVRIDAANGTRFTFVDIGTGLCSPVLPKAEYLGLLRIGYCKPPPAPPPPPWAGLGGSYAAWQAAHQPYSDTCPVGDCYGKDVTVGGEANSRFVEVDYSEITGVVDQYWQAIGDGTPIERAERNVAALLPADATTTRRFVQHDHNGDICVLWDLKSKDASDTGRQELRGTAGRSRRRHRCGARRDPERRTESATDQRTAGEYHPGELRDGLRAYGRPLHEVRRRSLNRRSVWARVSSTADGTGPRC